MPEHSPKTDLFSVSRRNVICFLEGATFRPWCTEAIFPSASFNLIQSNSGAFTNLVQLIWAAVKPAIPLGCGPNQLDSDPAEEVLFAELQTNCGVVCLTELDHTQLQEAVCVSVEAVPIAQVHIMD